MSPRRIQKGHLRRSQNEPDHRCPQKGTTTSIERVRRVSHLKGSLPEEKNGEEDLRSDGFLPALVSSAFVSFYSFF